MLAVTVEVWPGGDIRRRRVIHTISMANISDLNDLSDYSLHIDGIEYADVRQHMRSNGALVLIKRALNESGITET